MYWREVEEDFGWEVGAGNVLDLRRDDGPDKFESDPARLIMPDHVYAGVDAGVVTCAMYWSLSEAQRADAVRKSLISLVTTEGLGKGPAPACRNFAGCTSCKVSRYTHVGKIPSWARELQGRSGK